MPGTPHHALGNPLLTGLATTALAAVVVGTLAVVRSRFSDAFAYAAIGGLAYGLVYLALWALVPAVFWRFAIDPIADPAFAVGSVGVGALGALEAGIRRVTAPRDDVTEHRR